MKPPKKKSPKKSLGKARQLASLAIRPVTKPVDEITAVSSDVPEKTYATTAAEQQQVTVIKYVEIDGTACNDCYSLPDTAKVVHAVSSRFTEDRSKRLVSRGHGIWRIETQNTDLYKDVEFLEYGDEKVAKVAIREEKTFLNSDGKLVRRSNDDRSDELLVTLYQADTERFSEINEKDIYDKIVHMGVGHVKKGLTQQMMLRSDIPNGNLYFILKGVSDTDKERIPPSFEFPSEKYGTLRMWVNFRGKKRRCFFCSCFHDDSGCPTRDKIRMMEGERDALKEKNGNKFAVKMYGDSTLRHVSQKALACDVDAMSGGTTGNVLNAIDIDNNDDIPHVIICAGQNELNPRHTREEFVWMQKCKNERLINLAKKKTVTVLSPPKQSFLDAEGQVRERLYRENLVTLAKSVNIIENPLEGYEADDGRHPSSEQTRVLIEHLDAKLAEHVKLLLPSAPRDLFVSDRYYGSVQALYKYGCAACSDRSQNKWSLLCDLCSTKASSDADVVKSVKKIAKLVTDLDKVLNPALSEGMAKKPFNDPYGPPQSVDRTARERSPITEEVCAKDVDDKEERTAGRSRRSTILHGK